jgi:hypothetical protein
MTRRTLEQRGDFRMNSKIPQHRVSRIIVQIDRDLRAIVVDPRRPGDHAVRFQFAVAGSDIDGKPGLYKRREFI